MHYNMTGIVRSKILKSNEENFSILNLKRKIEAIHNSYIGKISNFTNYESCANEISATINSTVQHHIDAVDISSKFEKEFKEFLVDIIDIVVE